MNHPKVFLRRFKETDLSAVLRIDKLSFAVQPRSAAWFRNRASLQPENFIVAQIDDKIVGYAISQIADKKGKIIRIAVDFQYRREGIGRQLMVHILNHFKKKEVKRVRVQVRATNQGSIKFFQNFHFQISKVLKRYYFDGADAYLMEKKL